MAVRAPAILLAGWRHPSGYRVDARSSRLHGDPAVLVLVEN